MYLRVPRPENSGRVHRKETLTKVFCVNLQKIDESRAFSANDRILSREPDMTTLAETQPQIERRSADKVFALRRRNSAGVHQGIVFEISIVIDFDLDEI